VEEPLLVIVRSPAEREALLELLREYEESLPRDLRHEQDLSQAVVATMVAPPATAMIAWFDGAPAGCVIVRALDAKSAIMQRLYVQDRARGQGLGRALVLDAIRHAANANFERIVLDMDAERLAPAYRLYCSLGFTRCEPYGAVSYENPAFMELPLR